MKLGNKKIILSIFLLSFYSQSSFSEDKIISAPLINLNELKPSFEEVDNSIIEYQESTTPELDEKYWSRLIKSDENPGWLWDPIENEWVADPELSKGGDE